jgi:copper(I)-binding protein
MKALRIAAVVAALMLVVAACGDDSDGVTAEGQWARTSPKTAANGAAYMVLSAPTDDALVGATVDSSIASRAETHEMVMDADGAMMMQQTQSIPILADGGLTLEPGGYHIMFIDLAQPFEMGQKFEVTLHFATAEDLVVEIEVMEEAP